MSSSLIFGVLAVSFLVLAQGADILVTNVKALATQLKINIFLLGLLLGLLTTMPELILSITSSRQGLANVSLGNLLGGVIVLIGLVLGLAIIFHRTIKTDGRLATVAPGPLLFVLPLILGLKGWLNRWDGLVIILAYLAVVYYNSGVRHQLPTESSDKLLAAADARPRRFWRRRLDAFYRFINSLRKLQFKKLLANRHVWLALFGFVLISGASQVIVHFSAELLERWRWPQLAVGVLVFSIGTNLPEIAVTFRALIKKAGDLSISHLLGSCISNVLIVGILLQFGRLSIHSLVSFGLIIAATVLISGLFLLFYRSDKCFHRWEGVVLVAVYLAFLTSQLLWAI